MSQSETIQFINCRILRNHQLIRDHFWVRDGKIIDPEPVFFDEQRKADRQIDCLDAIIAAGFIELQINGGYGVDFSFDVDTVAEGVDKVARGLIQHGVTSFCPTIVTSPPEIYHKILPRIPRSTNGASILGIHLEGPFIHEEKKGAHPAHCIRSLEKGIDSVLEVYGELDRVIIITLAPEKDLSGDVTRWLTEKGITVSLGHSMATLKDGEKAVANGARLITHLFNAMLPFHHRDPGLVGLLASNAVPPGQKVYFGIISDGVHTDPAALRIAQRTHPQGLCLTTDAIAALGLAPGRYHIGQLELEIRDNRAYIAGTETLCGSIAFLDECVRVFIEATDCSIVEAIEAVTLHPAECLRVTDRKGTLDFGTDADFVILDDKLHVKSTWISGKCVYNTEDL